MRAIFVFAVTFAAVTAAPRTSERIIGGIQTSINQYPYVTALLYEVNASFYVQFCGGTIITTRCILSAAHCLSADQAPRLRLRVGSTYAHSGGTVYSAEAIINHAEHNIPDLDNDVSIIWTVEPIVYSSTIQAATIAGANYVIGDNDVVWPVGWGHTAHQGSPSEELRHAQTWIINQELCAQRYTEIGRGVTANMICSGWLDMGGRGQCNGDSGSPLVHNGIVIGITAWSHECALGRYPTVSMRTSRYTAWIRTHSTENSSRLRIFGGPPTTISQHPTIAALLHSSDLHFYLQLCGGTILTHRSILTAAHCSDGDLINKWRVRVGSSYANSGGLVLHLANIIYHPSYNNQTYDSDIAIMRTSTSINYVKDAVQPAVTAGANYNLVDNEIVWAAGWDATAFDGPGSEQLRHVQIWTVNQDVCAQRYATLRYPITANMLCSGWLDVGGRDQCQGDSGGPLYHNNVVVGVCSWGESCALANYPGVSTRVSKFSSWIQGNA